MKLYVLLLIVVLVLLSACSASVPKPKMINREGINPLVLTDDHKVTYFKQDGHRERICASREADAVATSQTGVSMGFTTLGGTETIGEQSGRGELALGGRSPLVLITRELIYRACELTMNLNTDEKTSIEVYRMFLTSLAHIAKNHINQGSQPTSSELPFLNVPKADLEHEKSLSEDSSSESEEDSTDEDEE